MDETTRLTILCLNWRGIIAVKARQYKDLDKPNPSADDCYRLVKLSVQIHNLRRELAEMEDELCDHILVPPYLHA